MDFWGGVVPTGNTVGAQRPDHYGGCTGAAMVSGPLGRKEGPWWNAGSGLGGEHEAHPCWG